jgi:iron(III) transport system ATP-binding protein
VAGFVGKAAFIPVKIMEKQQESYRCRFNDKDLQITNFAPDLQPGSDAVLMARPESLRVVEPGKGKIEGKVRLDVYLGSSMECYVDTNLGEILVQVDDPHEKRIFDEGADVSIDFSMDRVRLLDTSTN